MTIEASSTGMAMTTPRVPEPPLPMFQDRLRIPPVLHPCPDR